jgi:RNA polymerase sigma-70 factor (ECF subfamily)
MTTRVDVDRRAVLDELEAQRRPLTGYCYRMLGSAFEADDAVQETMIRAWKGFEGFEGRSALRSWLYRIATNVCLDMLRGRQRRARPMDLGPAHTVESFRGVTKPENAWIQPVPDALVVSPEDDPAEQAATRDSVRLAFVTALQHLPPRQRAVLVLREVLRWPAADVAELLDTSVASVNSALQRARATLGTLDLDGGEAPVDAEHQELLARYVDAFERYDIEALVALLHDDAVMSMPPFSMWIEGAAKIGTFMTLPGPAQCANSKLIPVRANGCPAFAQYKPDHENGGYSPWGLQVLEIADGRIAHWNCFLDTASIFPTFGLPDHLPA